jgi:thiazole synthase ThiGH ThiG subunit
MKLFAVAASMLLLVPFMTMMAEAFKHSVIAGRMGYKAGRIPKKPFATASSPIDGLIQF